MYGPLNVISSRGNKRFYRSIDFSTIKPSEFLGAQDTTSPGIVDSKSNDETIKTHEIVVREDGRRLRYDLTLIENQVVPDQILMIQLKPKRELCKEFNFDILDLGKQSNLTLTDKNVEYLVYYPNQDTIDPDANGQLFKVKALPKVTTISTISNEVMSNNSHYNHRTRSHLEELAALVTNNNPIDTQHLITNPKEFFKLITRINSKIDINKKYLVICLTAKTKINLEKFNITKTYEYRCLLQYLQSNAMSRWNMFRVSAISLASGVAAGYGIYKLAQHMSSQEPACSPSSINYQLDPRLFKVRWNCYTSDILLKLSTSALDLENPAFDTLHAEPRKQWKDFKTIYDIYMRKYRLDDDQVFCDDIKTLTLIPLSENLRDDKMITSSMEMARHKIELFLETYIVKGHRKIVSQDHYDALLSYINNVLIDCLAGKDVSIMSWDQINIMLWNKIKGIGTPINDPLYNYKKYQGKMAHYAFLMLVDSSQLQDDDHI
jgi:hypothetical protein